MITITNQNFKISQIETKFSLRSFIKKPLSRKTQFSRIIKSREPRPGAVNISTSYSPAILPHASCMACFNYLATLIYLKPTFFYKLPSSIATKVQYYRLSKSNISVSWNLNQKYKLFEHLPECININKKSHKRLATKYE